MRKVILAGAALALAAISAPSASAFSEDSLVWKKCASCHEPVDGRLARVQEVRTTPEEWTVIVDRMQRLYGMELGKGEMDVLLKELSATQILTPTEMDKVAYLNLFNNPQHIEGPNGADEERLFATCVRCHSFGKIVSYRMTPDHWAKVRDFHLYVDPAIILQMREMHWRDEADVALQYLAKAYPYGEAWKAPDAQPAGKWLVLGYEPGKGSYRGTAEVTDLGNGDLSLAGSLQFSDGTSEVFSGDGTLYGGYALRTRTRHNGFETMGAYSLVDGILRGEHHFPAPYFRTSSSTWHRLDGVARVLRVTPDYLLANEETAVTVEGVNLPEVGAADLAFTDAKVEVVAAKRVGAEAVEARVVYRGAGLSPRGSSFERQGGGGLVETEGQAKLRVKGLEAGTVRLAGAIDRIAVTPGTGRARLDGGPHYPAEGVQFEAVAYGAGDVALGPVPARFYLAEESTRDNDDDLAWVGAIAANGTFVPAGDYAPVPAREYQGEASGWVKVVAEYVHGGTTHVGEAKLAVTVPDFIQRIK